MNKATLILEDGSSYDGIAYGGTRSCSGELVFHTGLTGYTESLSDPSFFGQILLCTYPLIGNYGMPQWPENKGLAPKSFESNRLQVAGLVCSQLYQPSEGLALQDWFAAYKRPIITGVDTRALVHRLRESGTQLAKIIVKEDLPFFNPNDQCLQPQVSTSIPVKYGNGKYKVAVLDFGLKHNILRSLLNRDLELYVLPWDSDLSTNEYDALVLSNGPGNPLFCEEVIPQIQQFLKKKKPVLGICLGHQLLAMALGCSSYKLPFGHRGHNHAVRMCGSHRCLITAQNHGFAVDTTYLPEGWEVWFEHLSDGTCEGIRHQNLPFASVQFHPEAAAGPEDGRFIFDDFERQIKIGHSQKKDNPK